MQEDFITKILGIQGFSVADIKFGWKKDKEVVIIYLKREYKYCCCSKCGISVRETHSHREYWAWDLPMSGRRVRLVFEKFRVKCPRCGIKTEKLPFIDNRSHCTNRLEQVIAHRCKGATVLLKLNRKLAKADLLKEIFDRLWEFTYIGAAKRFLANWISQLRWSRLPALKRFAKMILAHAEGILNYCREKVNLGFVEGINNKIKNIKRKAYGYREIEYFKLKII